MKKEKINFRVGKNIYKRSLNELQLSNKAQSVIKKNGFETIEDVIDNTDKLRNTTGCDIVTVREILSSIANLCIVEKVGG